jgi:hypothetical protein
MRGKLGGLSIEGFWQVLGLERATYRTTTVAEYRRRRTSKEVLLGRYAWHFGRGN